MYVCTCTIHTSKARTCFIRWHLQRRHQLRWKNLKFPYICSKAYIYLTMYVQYICTYVHISHDGGRYKLKMEKKRKKNYIFFTLSTRTSPPWTTRDQTLVKSKLGFSYIHRNTSSLVLFPTWHVFNPPFFFIGGKEKKKKRKKKERRLACMYVCICNSTIYVRRIQKPKIN